MLSPAEIAGLITAIGLSIKIIDKLVDAMVHKIKAANHKNNNPHSGPIGELGLKLDRIHDILVSIREELTRHDERTERAHTALQSLVERGR